MSRVHDHISTCLEALASLERSEGFVELSDPEQRAWSTLREALEAIQGSLRDLDLQDEALEARLDDELDYDIPDDEW